jgi:CIC family chloride channel protein
MAAGAIAGVFGLLFMFTLARSEDFFDRLPVPGWIQPAIGGALVGLIGIWLPQVFGVGYATIAASLQSELPAVLLGLLVFAKIAATSLTLASGGSGGIFAPSLFLGAMVGGFVGSFIHQWFPESTAASGAYALVTMGAFVAATTRAPITAIIILFEMTQSIDIIPPLMAACVVSTLVSAYFYKESIYTENLLRRGIDLYEDSGPNMLKDLYVHEIMDRDPEVLRDSAGFAELLDRILGSERDDFFVVDRDDRLVGWIHLRDFTRSLAEQEVLAEIVVAGDLADPAPPSVYDTNDLGVVMQMFSTRTAEEIAVVSQDDPTRILGSVHKADVIQAYNRELLRRDLAGSVSSQVLVASRGQQVALGGGYVLQQILPPPRFFGHSLRSLKLGAEAGVQIVLLRKRKPQDGKPAIRVPHADDVIEEGDRLVVSGTKAAVESLDAF